MGERKILGYAAKLVRPGGAPKWVGIDDLTDVKEERYVDKVHWKVLNNAVQALGDTSLNDNYKIRMVVLYRKTGRTAEQERADVVAWLKADGDAYARSRAERIADGAHEGAAK